MKRCTKCHIDYFDNELEFCLEDGTKLVNLTNFEEDITTLTKSNKPYPTTTETVNLPFPNTAKTLEFSSQHLDKNVQTIRQTESVKSNPIKENLTNQSYKILEITPIFISLAHNWWQWIYLNNQYYSSLPSFLVSANFLMWLILLLAGVSISLLAVKKSLNKGFAIASLVILSINLILFLVPKR
jgi:hypothetical protein